jgi:hypothetical protein
MLPWTCKIFTLVGGDLTIATVFVYEYTHNNKKGFN